MNFEKMEARLKEPIKNTIRYYTKSELLKIASVVLAPLGIYNFIKLYKKLKHYSNFTTEFISKGRTVTNDGPPGAGKTFLGINTAYTLASEQWEKLQDDYVTQKAMLADWLKAGDTDKLEAFKTLEESYLFYKEREDKYIPCLISSIPLREYGTGRMSYAITPEIFLQQDRVPEYSILFIDEIGEEQGVSISMTTDPNYLAFWRYIRHFFEGKAVNTNQDGSQAAIAVRRSTDYVNHIIGQEWLMRPTALIKRFNRIKERYYKRLESGIYSKALAERTARKLYYLKRYIATIGFRQVTCQLYTTKGVAVGNEIKFILPAIGCVQYDDRTFRKQYKCRKQEIHLHAWEKLIIDEYDHSNFAEQVKGRKAQSKRRSS